MRTGMKWMLILVLAGLFFLQLPVLRAQENDEKTYVGSEMCGECHDAQFERFTRFAKKAHSFTSITRMAGKLTPTELRECYSCHTTGYGHPGGFRSEEETPVLKNNGCESCHGPGSLHVESEDPDDLEEVSAEGCTRCHNSSRVKSFNFKPLLYSGAH